MSCSLTFSLERLTKVGLITWNPSSKIIRCYSPISFKTILQWRDKIYCYTSSVSQDPGSIKKMIQQPPRVQRYYRNLSMPRKLFLIFSPCVTKEHAANYVTPNAGIYGEQVGHCFYFLLAAASERHFQWTSIFLLISYLFHLCTIIVLSIVWKPII